VGARAYVCDRTFSFSARGREKLFENVRAHPTEKAPFPSACSMLLPFDTLHNINRLGNYARSCYNVIAKLAKKGEQMKRIAVLLSLFGGALAILSHHVQIYPHMSNVQRVNLALYDLAPP
jgi:hypothetical protein